MMQKANDLETEIRLAGLSWLLPHAYMYLKELLVLLSILQNCFHIAFKDSMKHLIPHTHIHIQIYIYTYMYMYRPYVQYLFSTFWT